MIQQTGYENDEEKFKYRVTNSWLRNFYQKRGGERCYSNVELKSLNALCKLVLFWVDFSLVPFQVSFLCLTWIRIHHHLCLILDLDDFTSNLLCVVNPKQNSQMCFFETTFPQNILYLEVMRHKALPESPRTTYCCYVGLLLWRSLSPSPWDGQLDARHREEPFPSRSLCLLSLHASWGVQPEGVRGGSSFKVIKIKQWLTSAYTKGNWPNPGSDKTLQVSSLVVEVVRGVSEKFVLHHCCWLEKLKLCLMSRKSQLCSLYTYFCFCSFW